MQIDALIEDPSQNYLKRLPQPLDSLFSPQTIAIIGAKDDPGSVARTILANLKPGPFTLFPVNPKRTEVMGIPSYPSIASLPSPIDLAIIATPAQAVPKVIQECNLAHVKSAIIISAGFKELGETGAKLEREILRYCEHKTMPIIGPNCLGVMNPRSGLNATFAKGMAKRGNVAFLSQSGALCTAVLDWSLEENIGFSAFVSVGSMIDVGWGDLIRYFGDDPETQSILLYMETVGDPRTFLSAARETALRKPIVVIKPGRTQAAAKAAASHTGSLAGNDAVFDAALERVGVLRVDTISQLFDMAEVLAKQPLPKGPKLGILTNAGGPAVLATDAAIQRGAQVPPLSNETADALNAFLPPFWSRHNPVDILGDAQSDLYERTLDILLKAPEFDGILTILTPQDMTEPLATAQLLSKHRSSKPLLASWMGAETVRQATQILNEAGISTFKFPDEAAASFANMWRHHENLKALYEITGPAKKIPLSAYEMQKKRIEHAQSYRPSNGNLLDEEQSKSLLSLYGIPVVETRRAATAGQAVEAAHAIGYPVVVKLLSSTITHKSDVGGVHLNLKSDEEVQAAFEKMQARIPPGDFEGVSVQKMADTKGVELILGSTTDPQFGPVLLFGAGGKMVEIYQDTALALPPLGSLHARKLMSKTKIFKALTGFRDIKHIPLDPLVEILMQFSQLIVENPWILESDINPLLATEQGILALDARIVAGDQAVKTALRPYLFEYCTPAQLKDSTPLILRPIQADDVPELEAFHRRLSDHTVHQRFLKFLSLSERVAHERLTRICINDFTQEYVLVAQLIDQDAIIGAIRLSKIPSSLRAELFLIIEDAFQNKGLGTLFLRTMLTIAKKEGIKKITAKILNENTGMIVLCKKFGFALEEEGSLVIATYTVCSD